jgi:Lon protease-like protein
MLASSVRLLPLAGLVAFPGAPPYHVSVATGIISDGASVGLIHRRDGRMASVGTLATAHVVEAGADACVLACTASSRFRILELSGGEDGEPLSCTYEPVDDGPPDDEKEDARLCADLRQRMRDLSRLTGFEQPGAAEETSRDVAALERSESPAVYSLALAAVVEHAAPSDAQALLECTSTAERLRALDAAIAEAVQFESTRAMLARLGM